ncbi:CoA-binding protein [Zhihengliuella alba]
MDAAAGDRAQDRRPGNDDAVVRRLLTTPGRWAVVGLTTNRRRVAPGVAAWLRDVRGLEIVPVNLSGEDVLGERGYTRLADIPGRIDVVDCFVNSQRVGAVVDQAIEIGASAVWMQLGVVDHAAAERARAAGLDVVMDTCPKIEAPRLGL